jgi:DNA-binding transcriptional MerR regulator
MYSIGEFAKLVGVTTQTLRNWDESGKLKPILLESGHRRYTDTHLNEIRGIKHIERLNIVYCRESTRQQKTSQDSQVDRCKLFCEKSRYLCR